MRRTTRSGWLLVAMLVIVSTAFAPGVLAEGPGETNPVGTTFIVGDSARAGTPRTTYLPVTASASVRFCSPYDENPSCADQTLTGFTIVGFNFSYDATFTYTILGWWSLLEFDLPSDLAGATVTSAYLRLHPSMIMPQAYETAYRVNAVANAWNQNTITFNTLPGSLYYTSHQASVAGSSLLVDTAAYWDVTGVVANWASGAWVNNGLYLWDPNFSYPGYTSWRGVSFHSAADTAPAAWKPQLVIEYQPEVTWYCNGIEADIVGTMGDDTLVGTAGPDVIVGLDGNDKIFGKGGDDLICAGAGNDQVQGKTGRDTLIGEDGNDVLIGGDDKDRLFGMDGRDRLYGEGHHDILKGGKNLDWLWGGLGNDRLYGGAGNDEIAGQKGDDLMWGQRGNDILTGGAGTDTADGGKHTDTCSAETVVLCNP